VGHQRGNRPEAEGQRERTNVPGHVSDLRCLTALGSAPDDNAAAEGFRGHAGLSRAHSELEPLPVPPVAIGLQRVREV